MIFPDLMAQIPVETPAEALARRQAGARRGVTLDDLNEMGQAVFAQRLAAASQPDAALPPVEPIPQTVGTTDGRRLRPGLSLGINA
ncbi:hypothetical protein D9M68_824010 [compost metagenome]